MIREASTADLADALTIERLAFGRDDEAELVKHLLKDSSAEPILSLLAFEQERAVGHLLFTAGHWRDKQLAVPISFLAPLAVVPDRQRQGIGSQLVEAGLQRLAALGTQLVFVVGYPSYYPRFGFEPAGPLGFSPPYPMPEAVADAWMVKALSPGIIGNVSGQVICADTLNRPEYWRES